VVRELFTMRGCPFCDELRARLDWEGVDYEEHDVARDAAARSRLIALAGPNPLVPLLVEDGRVAQTGVGGRGCTVGPA
jgi:glutaredoxin